MVHNPPRTSEQPRRGDRVCCISRSMGERYLALDGSTFVVTVDRSTQGSAGSGTWASISGGNTSSLGEILFALGFANLNLLLFTTTTELIRLESALGLELVATMLWDVALRHDVDVFLILDWISMPSLSLQLGEYNG